MRLRLNGRTEQLSDGFWYTNASMPPWNPPVCNCDRIFSLIDPHYPCAVHGLVGARECLKHFYARSTIPSHDLAIICLFIFSKGYCRGHSGAIGFIPSCASHHVTPKSDTAFCTTGYERVLSPNMIISSMSTVTWQDSYERSMNSSRIYLRWSVLNVASVFLTFTRYIN